MHAIYQLTQSQSAYTFRAYLISSRVPAVHLTSVCYTVVAHCRQAVLPQVPAAEHMPFAKATWVHALPQRTVERQSQHGSEALPPAAHTFGKD